MQNLSAEYHRSISWIQKQILEYEPAYIVHRPRATNLVCDATFYGKRKDKLGILVFKDSIIKEVLIWKHIQSETIKDYRVKCVTFIKKEYYRGYYFDLSIQMKLSLPRT